MNSKSGRRSLLEVIESRYLEVNQLLANCYQFEAKSVGYELSLCPNFRNRA